MLFMTVTDRSHRTEDQRQHHKDKRLNDTDKDFECIERQWQEEGNEEGHRCQDYFTGKDVAKETKAKSKNAGELGNDFQEAHKARNDAHTDIRACSVCKFGEISAT